MCWHCWRRKPALILISIRRSHPTFIQTNANHFFMLAILIFCNYESLLSVFKRPLFTSHLFLYTNAWKSVRHIMRPMLDKYPVIFQVLWKVYWQSTWFNMAQHFPLYLHTAAKCTSPSLISRHYSHTYESKITTPVPLMVGLKPNNLI